MEAISGVRKAFSIKPGYCFRTYLGSQCLALRKRIIIKHQSCDKFSVICEQKKQMVIGELRFFIFACYANPVFKWIGCFTLRCRRAGQNGQSQHDDA